MQNRHRVEAYPVKEHKHLRICNASEHGIDEDEGGHENILQVPFQLRQERSWKECS